MPEAMFVSPLWWMFTAVNVFVHVMLLTLGWMLRGEHPVWLVQSCARLQLLAAGVRLEVTGLEHLPRGGGVLLAANHKSYFDIFALLAICPRRVRWVIKESLLKMPLLGTYLRQNRAIALDRGRPAQAARQVVAAARDLAAGEAFVVFPEGTRVAGPELGEFKGGAFQMALRGGCPVAPLAIEGSGEVMAARSLRVRFGKTIRLTFCESLAAKNFAKDREGLGRAVREEIVKILEEGPTT